MAKIPRRPKGTRAPASPDPSTSYAPPHIGSGAFGAAPFSKPFGGGLPLPERELTPEALPGGEIDPASLPKNQGAFDSGAFDTGGFQTGPIASAAAPEQKHAPEPVRDTGWLSVQAERPLRQDRDPPGPISLHEAQDGQRQYVHAPASGPSAGTAPPAAESVTAHVARELRTPAPPPQNATEAVARQIREASLRPGIDRAAALLSLRALITVFEEVEQFDSHRQHNQPSPALWIDDADYLRNVKDLVHELHRLNNLLEAEATEANKEDVAKTSGLIGNMAEKALLAASTVIGAGIGGLVLASAYTVLSYTDAGAEVLNRLPVIAKGK